MIDPTEESVDRHVLWLEARVSKDGVIKDPKTKEVSQRIVSTIKLKLFRNFDYSYNV